MRATWSRLFTWTRTPRLVRSRRAAAPAVQELEHRRVLSDVTTTVVVLVDGTVTPQVLYPPNGRFVPVTVTGTVREIEIVGGKATLLHPTSIKEPPRTSFQLVDTYGQLAAKRPIALVPGQNSYSFRFTLNLKASRADNLAQGRQYYIIVGSQGPNGSNGKVLAVQVPHSLTERGKPPQKVPPKKAAAKAHPKPPPKAKPHGLFF